MESANSSKVKYEDPFGFFSNDEEEKGWRNALIYSIGVLFMLFIGLLGNGMLK